VTYDIIVGPHDVCVSKVVNSGRVLFNFVAKAREVLVNPKGERRSIHRYRG